MHRPFAAHPEAFAAYYLPMSEAALRPAAFAGRARTFVSRIRLTFAGRRA